MKSPLGAQIKSVLVEEDQPPLFDFFRILRDLYNLYNLYNLL